MPALSKHARLMPLLFVLGAGLGFAPPAQAREDAEQRPNVVIIIADDLGYNDVSFNGGVEIPTPHIDRVANEGVHFTRGYVTYPVCGPSRAGLLTGRHQSRFGFDRNPNGDPDDERGGLPRSEEMMSEMLKRGGYTTMAVGKWHMGTHENLRPLVRGFDEFYGFLEGGHNYFPSDVWMEDISQSRRTYDWYQTKLLHNEERVTFSKYLTEELTDYAVDWIERKAGGEDPFFLYLAYNAPHAPLQAPEEYLARFPNIEASNRRTYAAMVSAMDDGVGRVLDAIDAQGVAEDTIVVFLSDNGGVVTTETGERPVADNAPLRGGKSQLFEGGVRVPFAMRWPRRFVGGAQYSRPISSMDIFATLAGEIGIPVREDRPLDGVNLLPYLTGEVVGDPQPVLFWRKYDQNQHAMVIGDVKYFFNGEHRVMFDLRADQSETTNLGGANRPAMDRFEDVYSIWNTQMAPEPAFPPLGSWP